MVGQVDQSVEQLAPSVDRWPRQWNKQFMVKQWLPFVEQERKMIEPSIFTPHAGF